MYTAYVASAQEATVIAATGDLNVAELACIAALAARDRALGRPVVIDMTAVTHLHFAGARLLKTVQGLCIVGASRYVRDLLWAGGAGALLFYATVPEALSAP